MPALAAIGTLTEGGISLSDLISDLLENGVFVKFLIAITESDSYIEENGTKVPWDSVPCPSSEVSSPIFLPFLPPASSCQEIVNPNASYIIMKKNPSLPPSGACKTPGLSYPTPFAKPASTPLSISR
jgi:hypothetical protein